MIKLDIIYVSIETSCDIDNKPFKEEGYSVYQNRNKRLSPCFEHKEQAKKAKSNIVKWFKGSYC